jgi:hypothetical protein
MKRIDEGTVELTKAEQRVSHRFDYWLDEGYNCYEAIGRIVIVDELPVSVNLAYWLACSRTPSHRVYKARKRVEFAAKQS